MRSKQPALIFIVSVVVSTVDPPSSFTSDDCLMGQALQANDSTRKAMPIGVTEQGAMSAVTQSSHTCGNSEFVTMESRFEGPHSRGQNETHLNTSAPFAESSEPPYEGYALFYHEFRSRFPLLDWILRRSCHVTAIVIMIILVFLLV